MAHGLTVMLIDKCTPRGRAELSTGLHREHSFDVPTHRPQIPFASHVLQSPQQTLPISHHRFDDTKHRFGRLLAHSVELSSPRRLQPMRHLLHRCRRLGRRFRSGGKALFPTEVMASAPQGNQRFDLGRRAMLNVGLTEIAVVGEDALSSIEFFGQRLDFFDHRIALATLAQTTATGNEPRRRSPVRAVLELKPT
jgi:hypothetical protein